MRSSGPTGTPCASICPIAAFLLISLLVLPGPVWAAGGGPSSTGNTSLVLVLLGVLAAAYLLTHFVVERLQQRFLFVTGIEYVLVGVLLSPVVAELGSGAGLAPAVAFGVGWVALLRGTEQSVALLQESPRFSLRVAALEFVLTGSLITICAWAAFTHWLDVDTAQALQVAAMMGCAGAAGSTSATSLLSARFPQLAGGFLPTLARSARYTELIAIGGVGVILAVFHDQPLDAPVVLGPSDWVLLTLGLGVALGWLFSTFVGEERSDHIVFLAMVGIISLATGAALFVDLSGMAVNLVLGIVLANTASGAGLHTTLIRTRKPMVLTMLVLAGVLWRPVPWVEGLLVVGGYMSLRLVGKLVGSWLASAGTPLRGDLGRGGLAQGDVALAIALSMRLVVDDSLLVDLAFTAIVSSVVIFELMASRLLKGLLVDAGELRQDQDLRPRGMEAGT